MPYINSYTYDCVWLIDKAPKDGLSTFSQQLSGFVICFSIHRTQQEIFRAISELHLGLGLHPRRNPRLHDCYANLLSSRLHTML